MSASADMGEPQAALLPAPRGPSGEPRWFLHDPVRHAFHFIGEQAVKLLSVWRAAPVETVLKAAQKEADFEVTEDSLKSLTEFLYENKLTVDPPGGDTEKLAVQENAKRTPFHELLVHKYLFFRIPMFNPQNFLRRNARLAEVFFKRATWMTIAVIGVIGLLFTARQWESFVKTFLHFFTLEGFVFYALTLAVIKVLHEFGHAFAAHRYGARVPVIGLAFLVMFPILYTDTTDAWRIKDRKARLYIDAAGVMVELAIASISIFLWSFLPDGPARSIAFFAATTSWVMSLFVNLNPFMRFDGYYLMSDFFRVQNMQKRGFEYGRWLMRETLFKLGAPQPFPLKGKAKIGFAAYAYGTWVYRFFLFIGIAILVHHLFPKAIGIVLFTIEILFFIVAPIWRELKVWKGQAMTILSTARGRTTLCLAAALLAAFLLPWQTTARAPALLTPGLSVEIFPPAPARIDALLVKNGQIVERGETLARLSAPHLDHDLALATRRLALIDAQLNRMAASLEERRFGATLIEERAREVAQIASIEKLQNELVLRAPHDGRVTDLPSELHPARYVTATQRFMRVVGTKPSKLTVYPPEHLADRVAQGADIEFISEDPLLPKIKAQVSTLAPTALQHVEDRVLTQLGGGALAVYENKRGELIADTQLFRMEAELAPDNTYNIGQHRGVAHIKVASQSPASAVWRSVMGVLIRETDF